MHTANSLPTRSVTSHVSAHDEERNTISCELHDDIAQPLALLSISLQKCIEESLGSLPAALFSKLSAVRTDLEEISCSVRELSHGLHCSALRLGLRAALRGLCRAASEQDHIKVSFEGDDLRLSEQACLSLFRVVQRALSSAVRHGQAKEVFVKLQQARTGSNEHQRHRHGLRSRLGLVSMEERLRMIGGELKVTARLGEGTQISAQLGAPGNA